MITVIVVMMTLQSSDSWNSTTRTIYSDDMFGAIKACNAYGEGWLKSKKRGKQIPNTGYAYYCEFKGGAD